MPLRRTVALLSLLLASGAQAQGPIGACEEPNVLIVLDRSGSMREDDKWGQATTAISQLVIALEERIRFGLLVFPWNGRCSVALVNGALRVPVGPGNAGVLVGQLGNAAPEPANKTPIGAAVDQATAYYTMLADGARRGFVVLVTDGQETCGGDGQGAAARSLAAGFSVFVIGFGGGVDRGALNRMAQAGGTGAAYQANDGQELFDVLDSIVNVAGEEICDGRDNDCDGAIDEDLPDLPCQTPCGQGRQICVDGRPSECFGGDIPLEQCDGIDNDCDGAIDEDLLEPCVTLQGDPGTRACVEGALAEACEPDDPERCDGVDNDGDGAIDEDTDEACSVGCHPGRRPCVEGSLIGCTAAPVGPERCNGVDDDCDGMIDEAATCAGEAICGHEGLCLEPCQSNECPLHFACAADGFCHPKLCDPFCGIDQVCVLEICRDRCVLDRDCAQAGQRCSGGLCGGSGGAGGAPGPEPDARGGGSGSRPFDATAPIGDDDSGPEQGAGSEAGCQCEAAGPRPALPALIGLLFYAGRRRLPYTRPSRSTEEHHA